MPLLAKVQLASVNTANLLVAYLFESQKLLTKGAQFVSWHRAQQEFTPVNNLLY